MDKKLDKLGLADEYKKATVEGWSPELFSTLEDVKKAEAIKEHIKSYINNFHSEDKMIVHLWFHGSYGNGKTFLSCAIARDLLREDYNLKVKIHTLKQLLDKIRNFDQDGRTVTEKIKNEFGNNVDILIIDDIDKETLTDWGKGIFYEIINTRANKPTIISANHSPDEFLIYHNRDDKIGASIERLEARGKVLHFPDESIRKKIAREKNTY